MEQVYNKLCISKMFIAVEVLINFLILMALMQGNQMLMNIVVVIACCSIIVFSIEEGILLLLCVAVFENSITFNGNGGWIFMAGIFAVKCICASRMKFRSDIFIPTMFLLVLEFANEMFFYNIGGSAIGCLFLIILLACFTEQKDSIKIDAWSALLCIGLSYIVVILYLLFTYGGISEFVSQLMRSNNYFRLGMEQTSEFAGAMGLPLFSIIVSTIGISYLFGKQKTFVQTIIAYILIMFSIIFGALSIARSFYLAMAAVVLCILFAKRQTNKKVIFILVGCLLLLALFYFYQPIADKVIGNLQFRLHSDTSGTGGRLDIWESAIQYLFSHPMALLFGRGACGYQSIGHSQNYLFSAGCHNFFIDIVMSWGVVGFICLFKIVFKIVNIRGIIEAFKKNVFSVLPLIGLLVFSFTALRTNSLKPLIFFFVCFSLICRERSEQV